MTDAPRTLALAPMDGVTDHVFRELLTARARPGALAFAVSEFVRVTDRPLSAGMIRRACPEVSRGGVTGAGTPVLVQLLGGQVEPLAATARVAMSAGAHGIDLNFGCPAKLVNRHDGGACLLKTPERIEKIVACVRQAVPRDRPVSAKIRLGWDCRDDVAAIALAAERGGASWLTVHGRTKSEMYGPPADWVAIGSARRALAITTIANGDLNTDAALEPGERGRSRPRPAPRVRRAPRCGRLPGRPLRCPRQAVALPRDEGEPRRAPALRVGEAPRDGERRAHRARMRAPLPGPCDRPRPGRCPGQAFPSVL